MTSLIRGLGRALAPLLFRDLGLTCGILFLVRLFLLVAAANPTAFALDPSKTITQYNHQVWKTHDGLPSNSVLAILQSRDGFLWLGTQNGLVRFDGVSFKVFTGANVSELTDNRINCLFEAPDRTLPTIGRQRRDPYGQAESVVHCYFGAVADDVCAFGDSCRGDERN